MESIYNNGCNHNWEFQGVYPENFAQWHCKNCSIVHAQNLAEMMNELQRARQYKIDRSAYVPGHWQCPVCHFYNVVTILNANTGQCGMAKEHYDPFCPNDGHPMERVTWMQARESTEQTLKSEITRLAAERDTALADLAAARRKDMSDKIWADACAERDTWREQYEAQMKSTENLRDYALGKAEWDAPMNSFDLPARDEIKKLRADLATAREECERLRNICRKQVGLPKE